MLHAHRLEAHEQDGFILRSPYLVSGREPELYVARLCRFRTGGSYENHAVVREFGFTVFEEGRGEYAINGHVYEVGAGHALGVRQGDFYEHRDLPGESQRWTWVALRGAGVDSAIELAGLGHASPYRTGIDAAAFEPLFAQIEHAYQSDEFSDLFPVSAAWQFLDTLAGHGKLSSPPPDTGTADRTLHIIEQEFRSGVTIDQIARRLEVTRITVFRNFKDAYGQSPKQYLDELRLRYARERLRERAGSVKDVAQDSGFSDPHYFSRAYRNRFGVVPSRAGGVKE